MPPISEQFYDDDSDEDDDNNGDNAEGTESLSSAPSENETAENELKRTQVENAKLRAENRSLKSKQGSATSSASSASKPTVPYQEAVLHRDYRGLGKQFSIISQLWVSPLILRQPRPPLLDPWDLERCSNNAAWNKGNIAELYTLLPEAYHELIEGSALFSTMFLKGAKEMRSHLIDTVRKNAPEIFSIDSRTKLEYFSKSFNRSNDPVFTNLLKNPKRPHEQYPSYPQVLFTNYDVVPEELFGSCAISNILKVILLGPKSLTSASTQRSGPKGNAHTWGMKSITPGCIAMAAVVAQFIISPDHTFSEKGSVTGNNYHDRFEQYKKFIIKNLNSPQTTVLMTRLNEEVLRIYPSVPQPTPSPAGREEADEEEDEFSRAFQNKVVLSENTAGACAIMVNTSKSPAHSISTPTQIESSVSASDPSVGTPTPLPNSDKPLDIPDGEDEVAVVATRRTSKRSNTGVKKRKGGRGAKP